MRSALGKKVSILKHLKDSGHKEISKLPLSFPPHAFSELLRIASPRERLLYLLCGAAGARLGQALNLTTWDIDFQNKRVFLPDPKEDEIPRNKNGSPFLGQPGRKTLLWSKYKISANQSPHRLIRHHTLERLGKPRLIFLFLSLPGHVL